MLASAATGLALRLNRSKRLARNFLNNHQVCALMDYFARRDLLGQRQDAALASHIVWKAELFAFETWRSTAWEPTLEVS